MDLASRVDPRARATAAPKQPGAGQQADRCNLGHGGHPWHRWDDGRLWSGVYYVRSMMLIAFAAASWLSGAHDVAYVVIVLILPFNILEGSRHRQRGEAGWLLAADQYLAASCAVINPVVVIGVVACQLVGAVTGAMGLRQRVVQPSIVVGGVLLAAAGLIHHDRVLLAFCLPVPLSTMAIARAVVYLKHRNLTANRRYEELLDGINAYVFETDFHSGEMLYMNQRTRQIVGPGAHSDQPLFDLVHPDDRHLATETALKARQSGQPVTTEVREYELKNPLFLRMQRKL